MEKPISNAVEKESHYDGTYFKWQEPIGQFGAWANLTKFIEYISPESDVLDFGCGGGYLLKMIPCRRRLGIEINPVAANIARLNGLDIFTNPKDIPDECCDIIISNNALEHVRHPLQELESLKRILRPGGKLIFVVPCESISLAYEPNNISRHLYCWSPMCLGNLMSEAGYEVLESKPYIHKWPPRYELIAKWGGRKIFDLACRIYARYERSWFQVRTVAKRRSLPK